MWFLLDLGTIGTLNVSGSDGDWLMEVDYNTLVYNGGPFPSNANAEPNFLVTGLSQSVFSQVVLTGREREPVGICAVWKATWHAAFTASNANFLVPSRELLKRQSMTAVVHMRST